MALDAGTSVVPPLTRADEAKGEEAVVIAAVGRKEIDGDSSQRRRRSSPPAAVVPWHLLDELRDDEERFETEGGVVPTRTRTVG